MARERAPGGAPVDAERAAELGLAEAVLRWDPIGGSGFETHARAVIATKLRRASTGNARHEPRHQRVEGSNPATLFAFA